MNTAQPYILAGLICLTASGAHAGAWTQPKGTGQIIVTALHSDSPKGFGADGRVVSIDEYHKTTVDALVEYGVSDRTTLIAKPQFRSVSIDQPGDPSSSGLGLSEFGLRQRLTGNSGWIVSAQGSVLLPGGANDGARIAQAGANKTEADVRLLAGRPFKVGRRDAFVNLEGGYHWRGGDAPNEWRADATLGWRPQPKLLLLGQLFSTWSDGPGRNGFLAYRYHNAQASVVWDVNRAWSLQVGALAGVGGENALRERGLLLSVWRRF